MENTSSRKNIMQIAILVLSVVALIGSYFYVGGQPLNFGPSGGSNTNVTGNTVFSGTIRTYDPLIAIPLNTPASVIDEARQRDDVKNIRTESGYYVIDTETRDDVYTIASFLRSKNVSNIQAVANIAVTKPLEVETVAGRINASVPGGVIRIFMDPVFDSGSEVTVRMVAIVRNNVYLGYNSAGLALNELAVLMDARVVSLERKTFTYSIPWESRNSLNLSGNYSYKKVDSIIFTTPLDIAKVLEKKQFQYITYIDSGSAQVLPSFDNASQVAINFQDVQYRLPPSTLVIESEEDPGIGFNSSVSYFYSLVLEDPRVDASMNGIALEAPSELELNSTIKLNVTALEMGGKIFSLKRVSLPS